ncbi:hypothetical protein C4K68_17350 [Pokkaliibacter plantistimulans]|uniref:TonB-dependent hemoglobin/transferrin/lactoferrin family receptor n=1 Tax=Proteobacteria bacterium 228 TaxID=2083153 RepID=A0A2S5KMV8_9PROT|nr:TonB-dependent hemoglobin/transferrin/lactoferrin family receptor [Pokkaliibacter plantistimulans]PPC76151.1 hypothetical protein C4K68_17350 [Pokkaliibacter plantistimulans]
MKITPSLITAAITLAASTPLFAASASSSSVTSTDSSGSSQDKPVPVLQKVEVTDKAEPLTQKESAVSVISKEDLQKNMARSVADVFRYEPGVSVSRDSRFGIGSINIRGLDGDRVKITVDGVEQAEAYAPTSTYLRATRTTIDPESLESVEIVKGGDTVAGSGALAGSVKFRTKEPSSLLAAEGDDTYIAVKGGYRSDSDEFSKTATIANRTGDLETLLVYTRRDGHDTNNYGDGSDVTGTSRGLNDPGDTDSDNILAKAQYQLNDENRIGFVAERYVADSQFDLLSTGAGYHSDDESKRTHFGISHENTHANALYDSMKWQLDYQNTKTTNVTKVDSSGRVVDRYFEDDSYQFRTSLQKQIQNHALSYGLNYEYNDLDNLNKDTSSGTTRFSPQATGNTFGAYLKDSWAVNDRLTLLPVVRYDHYRYSTKSDQYIDSWGGANGNAFTAELGAEFRLSEVYTLFGKYGTGFRAPALDEMYYYYNAGRGYAILPNPDLKPEHSIFTEGGIRADGRYGSAELTAYYNRYRNFIENQYLLGTSSTYPLGEYSSVNLDRVVIKGLELKGSLNLDELSARIPEGLSLKGAVAYADGRNVGDDEPLNSVAPLSAVVGLNYDSPSQKWGGAVNVSWADGKKKDDLTSSTQYLAVPNYTVVDLTTYYKPTDKITINAGVFNLLDEKYWIWNNVRTQASSSSANLDRFTEAGRNVGVDVTYEF